MLDLAGNDRKNLEGSLAGLVFCCVALCLGTARADAQTGAAAKVEAEIRHEQKYVERETPSDRQFSTVDSETPGTDGRIGNCDPKERSDSPRLRSCYLTFVRKGKRESHRVLRPAVFPPTYFSGVHNDWGAMGGVERRKTTLFHVAHGWTRGDRRSEVEAAFGPLRFDPPCACELVSVRLWLLRL